MTARDPSDRTIITGLSLNEISVVDRPANPEAVFDCWKLSDGLDIAESAELAVLSCPACGAAAASGDRMSLRKIVREADLTALAAGLAKLAGELVPRLEALQKRVDDIASTPLPPQTAARGITLSAIGKSNDAGAIASQDIVAALARMTDEDRTLTLIKAAHANPIAPFARR